jgi:hypothetical protein
VLEGIDLAMLLKERKRVLLLAEAGYICSQGFDLALQDLVQYSLVPESLPGARVVVGE